MAPTAKTLTDIRNLGLRGQEQFEKIVNKFKDRVQAIRGRWVERDNLNGFNRLIQEDKTVEEAALGTWTGQQAQRFGFNQVEIQDLVEGPDGDYELVRVLFKP